MFFRSVAEVDCGISNLAETVGASDLGTDSNSKGA